MRNSDLSENCAARSYRWVWIWLALGVLFALLLLFNSVRDYFFVARILTVQQVRHQVTERIASFDRALAENPPSDQPLVSLLAAEMATASKKPIWILLRNPDGKVVGLDGTRERQVFTIEQELTHFRNHEPLFDVVPSSQGEAMVEVFPLYVRPRRPPPQQSSNQTHHGPFVIATEVAMPLSAADPAVLWPIRRNLVVNTSAAFALLLTVALSALGFRSYVHGKQLEQQLEIARQVQANLLPKNVELSGGIQVAVEYEPADEVAGDFYDLFNTKRGPALVIGDVSGKGVPAALLMGVIHGAVRSAKWSESKANHECETVELNRLLCERASDGSRFANDKGAGSSDIHNNIVAQSTCENAWAKGPVSANVDAANENDKSHTATVRYCDNPFVPISYSLCTRPPLWLRVATWRRLMSRGTGPNNGMPVPISTGTRVITNRSMHPAARNR
jgi:Stage II sporulation protein E (SpoIIE)